LGTKLVGYFKGGFFAESSGYGTYIVGQIDLSTGLRKNLFESRSKTVDLRDGSTFAVIREGDDAVIKNLKTGAEVRHAKNAYVTHVDKYVLVWSRKGAKTEAWLYDSARWNVVASAAN
jgi:hypothetical protein